MKLRNKKTGEVIDLDIANIKAQYGGISVIPEPVKLGGDEYVYYSLEGLVSEWEDYKPKVPLIKDEAKRSVFKAWAEILGRDLEKADFKYDAERNSFNCYIADSTIEFANGEGINCVDREIYTFRALCGEEEDEA